ncbi:DUF3558 family protein [Saccharopolyspora griseoalba]|uniref:DUF3558 family protein n=1 Tax=Saccharopolyspora griseoalba TaxID=1431848 RepID=A0ABW2LKA0_9PSEU
MGVALLLAGLAVSGCTAQESGTGTAPSGTTTAEDGTTTASATPSLTREVPPEQRQQLAGMPADRICALIAPADLEKLAFEVEPGRPRQAGEPPVQGCEFPGRSGRRSIVLGAQPAGFDGLGTTEVELGRVRGTQELRAGDCTVYAPVRGATLQVSVTTGEADEETCQNASGIAEYVLSGLVT